MKIHHFLLALLLFTGCCNFLAAQDTLILRNNKQVICTVTKIYPERIEYLDFGDSAKRQYYSYRKSDVIMIRYADGKTDTILKQAVFFMSDTTIANGENQYEKGFQDGFNRYRPTDERWAGIGAGIGNFLIPMGGIVIPIAYSTVKVSPRKIQDNEFMVSKSESYRKGYIDGATKRRRTAVWSSYGISTGAAVVGIVTLLVVTF